MSVRGSRSRASPQTALGNGGAHLADGFDAAGGEDYRTRDELDEEHVDVPMNKAIGEDAEQEGTEDGAKHRYLPAGKSSATDNRGGKGSEQPVFANDGVGVAEARDEEHSCAGGKKA